MNNQIVLEKFQQLPEQSRQQVVEFMDFLLQKTKTRKQKSKAAKSGFGSHKGLFKISEGFDEPLEDFKDYMP